MILTIWLLAGLFGGILYVLPEKAREIRKHMIAYWILNLMFGFYTLYEGILSQINEYRLKKLYKNSKL